MGALNDIFGVMFASMSSLKMRAEAGGKHISGAERLLADVELESAAVIMLQRALQHSRGSADKITFSIEEHQDEQIRPGVLPDLTNNLVDDWQQGRDVAQALLVEAGVAEVAAQNALLELHQGAAPGGESMRGAMLIDADSGERLEEDPARGVRASRMDLTDDARQFLEAALNSAGFNNTHVIEALTLAAKVIAAPNLVAELCWSDDPDYTAGYVASGCFGYQRISCLKQQGERRGGRAFFVRTADKDLATTIDWLERVPLLIDQIGTILPGKDWRCC